MREVLATPRQRVLYEAREIWHSGFVTFDSETTGLEWEDQVIQWAVCDQEGNVLGSGDIKPTVLISEGAYTIHGITEEQLAGAPSFAQVWPVISNLLADQTVVIYNSNFDIGKIISSAQAHGIKVAYDFVKAVCAMELFAEFYGEIHDYYGTYTWQKLTTAIDSLNIDVLGQVHSAAHDAAATALIIKKLAELAEKELPQGWHPPVWVKCAGGCGGSQECAEEGDIWYCAPCGVKANLYHSCPGCARHLTRPATGIACEDLCEFCLERLEQEKMLLTGKWHRCSGGYCSFSSNIVKSPHLDEHCEHCQRQREWKRRAEEIERARQEKIERERKEHRCAYAKEYRQRRKEREAENSRRAELGLPPLEVQRAQPVEEIFTYQGHQFQRRKDQYGRPEVYCLRCEAAWSRPPRGYCATIKTYRSWQAIPPHLKTQTQLLKLKLQPAKGQKATAVIDGAFDRYSLYDKNACVPMEHKARKKTAPNETQV